MKYITFNSSRVAKKMHVFFAERLDLDLIRVNTYRARHH